MPYKMFVDFVAAGREVVLRDQNFQRAITDDVVPADFIKEVMLTQYQESYQTDRMESLMVSPTSICHQKVKSAVCGTEVPVGHARAHYNPWTGEPGSSMFTRVCCDRCVEKDHNRGEDEEFSWRVFECHKDEFEEDDDY